MARVVRSPRRGADVLVRVLPAQDRRRPAVARAHHRRARAAGARASCRSPTAPAAAAGQRTREVVDVGAQGDVDHADGPPHLPGPHAAPRSPRSSTTTAPPASRTSSPSAATCPATRPTPGPSDYTLRVRADRRHRRRRLLDRRRRPPRGPPPLARPGDRPPASWPPSCAAPTSPSPSSSSRPSTTCASSTSSPRSASTSRCCPGSCRSPTPARSRRMAELSGAAVPAWLVDRLDGVDDPAEVRRIGVDVATALCAELLERGRARAALLHAEPQHGEPRDLRQPRARRVARRRGVAGWSSRPRGRSSGTRRGQAISRVPYLPGLDGMRALAVARGDGVPRQPVVAARRVPRRRGVLRHQRLPDHAAADRRARAHRPGRACGTSGSGGPGGCCRRCSRC